MVITATIISIGRVDLTGRADNLGRLTGCMGCIFDRVVGYRFFYISLFSLDLPNIYCDTGVEQADDIIIELFEVQSLQFF